MVTIRLRSMVWFVTGAMLSAAVMLMFVNAWRVDAAPGDTDSTFVPITPCRLVDTRPAPDRVGPHATLNDDGTTTIAARGSNGECIIPTDAVGLSMNVTALDATVPTFLTFWPTGSLPLVASLNPSPGQPPTPNAVTVSLSGAGSFKVYNLRGSVDIVIDVNGYYTKTSLTQLHTRLAALESAQSFSVTGEETVGVFMSSPPTAYVSVSVTAPVAGHVTLNSTALLYEPSNGFGATCAIFETGSIPGDFIGSNTPSFQQFQAGGSSVSGSLSGTRMFDIAAGVTTSFSLACDELGGNTYLRIANLTAIFTPEP